MQYINYKKISYILSETPGLSGKIAFEFLYNIIDSKDVLKFTVHGQGDNSKNLNSLLEMYDHTMLIMSKGNEKEFIIKNITINNRLLEILCALGEFPNFLKISKIDSNIHNSTNDYCWSIEYCDEVLTFIYIDKYFDDFKIALIEKELENKRISYERKEIKIIKTYIR